MMSEPAAPTRVVLDSKQAERFLDAPGRINDELRRSIARALGLLVPGLGHAFMGQMWGAVIFLGGFAGLTGYGLSQREPLWYLIGAGLLWLIQAIHIDSVSKND